MCINYTLEASKENHKFPTFQHPNQTEFQSST